MKSIFKIGQTMAAGFLFSAISLQTASAQIYNPATDPGLEGHVKGFVKAIDDATPVDISEIPLEKARDTYSYVTTLGDKSDLSGIDETEKTIQEDGISIKLHIVRPKGNIDQIPAFMYFHGGVWFLGDYETHRLILHDLVVRTGMAAVFVDFTRSPTAHYPQQNNEAYAATKWIAEHGQEVNIDGSKLAVAGNSIGGNMATVVALMAKEKGTPHLTFQALISPVTDADLDTDSYNKFATGRFLTKKVMQKGWDLYIPDPAKRKEIYASPLQATAEQLKGLPPALVITEENDVLLDEGDAYARKLDEAGVWVASTWYNGMMHDLLIINAIHGLPPVQAAIQQVAEALKQFNKNHCPKNKKMDTPINVSHQRVALKSNFDSFVKSIETVLNRLNPDWPSGLLSDPEAVKQHLTKVAGDTGLMIFGQQEHGKLLAIKGKPSKVIQYIIGNPLTAVEMTQHDIRAALYAPLRVIFYEGEDHVLYAEYDLPSSLFGQFGNEEILAVSKGLDKKLLEVILLADQKSN